MYYIYSCNLHTYAQNSDSPENCQCHPKQIYFCSDPYPCDVYDFDLFTFVTTETKPQIFLAKVFDFSAVLHAQFFIAIIRINILVVHMSEHSSCLWKLTFIEQHWCYFLYK